MHTRPRFPTLCALAAVGLLVPVLPRTAPAETPAAAVKAPTPLQLAYRFTPGEKHHYKLVALFTGHFPPFAAADSPPVNLLAEINYIATTNKLGPKGAEVAFDVDSVRVRILENPPSADGKITGDSVDWPLALSQAQSMLSVVATFRPDGSVVDVTGGDTSAIKVNIGFDLRKLFLTTVPVIFPAATVTPDQAWTFDDGVLGKSSSTTYQATLTKTTDAPKSTTFEIGEKGQSVVDAPLDKMGNSPKNPADAVGSLKGTITANGTLQFVAVKPIIAGTDSGLVHTGKMKLVANMTRFVPNPDMVGKMDKTDIDVHADITVTLEPNVKPAPAKTTPIHKAATSAKKGTHK